jgi:hypothetical protein
MIKHIVHHLVGQGTKVFPILRVEGLFDYMVVVVFTTQFAPPRRACDAEVKRY